MKDNFKHPLDYSHKTRHWTLPLLGCSFVRVLQTIVYISSGDCNTMLWWWRLLFVSDDLFSVYELTDRDQFHKPQHKSAHFWTFWMPLVLVQFANFWLTAIFFLKFVKDYFRESRKNNISICVGSKRHQLLPQSTTTFDWRYFAQVSFFS